MNEVEEFWEFLVEERRRAVEEERRAMEQGWSLEAIMQELERMEHNAVVLRGDFKKIGNLAMSEYWRGYGDAVEEMKQYVLKLRSIAEVLEQAKERLEKAKDKAVLRKEVDMEIDLTWCIADINEAIRRLRA